MLINHRSLSILSPPTKIRARVNFFPSNTPQKHNCDSQQFYSCHTHISFIFIPFARIAIEGAKLSGFSRKMRRDGNKCEAFSLCAHCILYILNVRIYIYFFCFARFYSLGGTWQLKWSVPIFHIAFSSCTCRVCIPPVFVFYFGPCVVCLSSAREFSDFLRRGKIRLFDWKTARKKRRFLSTFFEKVALELFLHTILYLVELVG